MNDPITQMNEWWNNAEEGTASNGDTAIWKKPDGSFEVFTAQDGDEAPNVRILARKPKPTPAWRDAVAVLARSASMRDQPKRAVWTWDPGMDRWDDEGGCHWANTGDLRDVTPLIEAEVTDEMVERAKRAGLSYTSDAIRRFLTAALGLEAE